jgi:MltA-interacting protein MipA
MYSQAMILQIAKFDFNPYHKRCCLFAALALIAQPAFAQSPPSDTASDTPSQSETRKGDERVEDRPVQPNNQDYKPLKFKFTYGIRLQVTDSARGTSKIKLRPELGFKYGQWSAGTNADPDVWLSTRGVQRDASLAYEAVSDQKWRVAFGLRLRNVTSGSNFNALESGRLTLRGRVLASYVITPHWSVAGELTQDLQNRGDGTTFSLGATRVWPLAERDQLSLGMGLKWANAEHWRTPYLFAQNQSPDILVQANALKSGFGAASIGLEYRYRLSDKTVLIGGLSASRSIAQLAQIQGSKINLGAQIGVLWFGVW